MHLSIKLFRLKGFIPKLHVMEWKSGMETGSKAPCSVHFLPGVGPGVDQHVREEEQHPFLRLPPTHLGAREESSNPETRFIQNTHSQMYALVCYIHVHVHVCLRQLHYKLRHFFSLVPSRPNFFSLTVKKRNCFFSSRKRKKAGTAGYEASIKDSIWF